MSRLSVLSGRWTTIAALSVLAVALVGLGVYGADQTMAPAAPLKSGMMNRLAERQGVGAGLLAAGRRLGFILDYLNEFPDVKTAVQEHRAKVKALQAQLKTLRELVRAKMQDAKSVEEREAAIETAKADAASILTKVVDEAIAHQKQMAELSEKHKADIVKLAVERAFERRTRAGKSAGKGVTTTEPAAAAKK